MQVRLQENFRRNLRTFIEQNGISQRRLGEMADVHFTFVSAILQGKQCPSLEIVEKLSKASGVPAEALILSKTDFSRWLAENTEPAAA